MYPSLLQVSTGYFVSRAFQGHRVADLHYTKRWNLLNSIDYILELDNERTHRRQVGRSAGVVSISIMMMHEGTSLPARLSSRPYNGSARGGCSRFWREPKRSHFARRGAEDQRNMPRTIASSFFEYIQSYTLFVFRLLKFDHKIRRRVLWRSSFSFRFCEKWSGTCKGKIING
jgi:hypothetical protein